MLAAIRPNWRDKRYGSVGGSGRRDFAWAVGYAAAVGEGDQSGHAFIVRWDGSMWKSVLVPNPGCQQVSNKRLDILPRDILRISVRTLQARKIEELAYRLLVVGAYARRPGTKASSGFRLSGPAVAVCQNAARC